MSTTYISRELRAAVAEDAGFRCGYCRTAQILFPMPLEVEHIQPESRDGRSDRSNLWLACTLCNKHKAARVSARDYVTGRMVPLFNPRLDKWNDHFEWVGLGERVRGLTPIGRATVRALRLNRRVRVGSRRLWISAGWHPPKD